MKIDILAILRSSEFWVVVAQGIIEATHSPVPPEYREVGWAYAGLRVVSKVAKFVIPNPNPSPNVKAGWFKADS